MNIHPDLVMALAYDRADRLRSAASAHRLVRTAVEQRRSDRIGRARCLLVVDGPATKIVQPNVVLPRELLHVTK